MIQFYNRIFKFPVKGSVFSSQPLLKRTPSLWHHDKQTFHYLGETNKNRKRLRKSEQKKFSNTF